VLFVFHLLFICYFTLPPDVHARALVISPSVLLSNKNYRIKVKATGYRRKGTGEARILFLTNMEPYGGNCITSPATGKHIIKYSYCYMLFLIYIIWIFSINLVFQVTLKSSEIVTCLDSSVSIVWSSNPLEWEQKNCQLKNLILTMLA
jgi:hypothetical protein